MGVGRRWKLILGVLVSCWLALGIWGLTSISGQIGLNAAASASASSASPSASPSHKATTPSASPSTAAPATSAAPHSLSVLSIAAYGPDGTADGDNEDDVSRINSGGSLPWHSNWYTTPQFGDLKSGTGLLLDLGREVTVSSLRLTLGSEPGADVQVFVGDSPSLSGQTAVGSAGDLSGSVKLLTGSQATGRYVIVWFTQLPPNSDPAGTYQVGVYDVVVDGS
jgi:putative peptidoglycan lipid II flippase